MTTIAEKVGSLATRRGADAAFSRSTEDAGTYNPRTDVTTPGTAGSYTVKVMTDKITPDDFAGATLILRNPVAVLVPNSEAVTFAPEPGHRFTLLGVAYTVATVAPRILDGAVQFWRVVGGV